MNSLETYLSKFDESAWLSAIEEIAESVHEVDRDAMRIWFRFYPLDLVRYLRAAEDRKAAEGGIVLQGDLDLSSQIDTSHHFLYGHRFWQTVKCKIDKAAQESKDEPSSLVEAIKDIAMRVAEKHKVDRSLTNAIAAVGLATLNQVGMEAFLATPGETAKPDGLMARSPEAIVAERAKDDSQGIFGFLKTVDKKFSVAFAGRDFSGKFPVVNEQQVTHAASQDKSQDWRKKDERCWDGPVPIECTAASCGTCWVGVIGGKDKLSEVKPRERRAMRIFGYNQPDDEKPYLRLACQSFAYGNATIVIPPWNAVFGKKVRGNVEEIELEPNTTSAKRLREVVKSVTSGE